MSLQPERLLVMLPSLCFALIVVVPIISAGWLDTVQDNSQHPGAHRLQLPLSLQSVVAADLPGTDDEQHAINQGGQQASISKQPDRRAIDYQ